MISKSSVTDDCVQGLLTVGPNFKLIGAIEGGITAQAKFEARVKLAKWDVKQTYPIANDEWDPAATEDPSRDGTDSIGKPEFDASVSANGYVKASVKPYVLLNTSTLIEFSQLTICP